MRKKKPGITGYRAFLAYGGIAGEWPEPVSRQAGAGLVDVPVQAEGVVQDAHGQFHVLFLDQDGDLDLGGADHQDVANQLFSCYAKVGDARALASVIGEDELSPLDKQYLVFGKAFEAEFVGQSETENRSVIETLDKGWELLGLLPREELDRIDTKVLNQYYQPTDIDLVEQAVSDAQSMME